MSSDREWFTQQIQALDKKYQTEIISLKQRVNELESKISSDRKTTSAPPKVPSSPPPLPTTMTPQTSTTGSMVASPAASSSTAGSPVYTLHSHTNTLHPYSDEEIAQQNRQHDALASAYEKTAIANRERTKAQEWLVRGNSIVPGSNDKVSVNGISYDALQCYMEAVDCDPTWSRAWNNVGLSLSGFKTVTFGGRAYTNQMCFVQAVICDPGDGNSWNNLAEALMETGEPSVHVNGKSYTVNQLYARANECVADD